MNLAGGLVHLCFIFLTSASNSKELYFRKREKSENSHCVVLLARKIFAIYVNKRGKRRGNLVALFN